MARRGYHFTHHLPAVVGSELSKRRSLDEPSGLYSCIFGGKNPMTSAPMNPMVKPVAFSQNERRIPAESVGQRGGEGQTVRDTRECQVEC